MPGDRAEKELSEKNVKRPEMTAGTPGGDPEHKRALTDETNSQTT